MENYFITILNDFKLPKQLPIDLGNWVLDKPIPEEFRFCRRLIRDFTTSSDYQTPGQERMLFTNKENDYPYYQNMSNQNEFRYLILRPKDLDEKKIKHICQAGRLSKSDVWIDILQFEDSNKTYKYQSDQLAGFITSKHGILYAPELNISNFEEVINLRENFNEIKYPQIINAIEMFINLDAIADKHKIKHLGYFTIIENILTHKPEDGDPENSIGKQLVRNLTSIEKVPSKVSNMLLSKFEDEKTIKQVITHLYHYRSAIAHGNNKEEIKSLNWLYKYKPTIEGLDCHYAHNKANWIGWYLRKLTKTILVHSLKDPQFISKLK